MERNPLVITEKAVGRRSEKTVNARDLHAFLEVGRDFTNWIKNRIKQWGFVEGKDYIRLEGLISPILASKGRKENVCSPVLASKGRGGHNVTEYALTLDMAKHLSMIERSRRGHEAREYFIECERRYRGLREQTAPVPPDTTRTPEELASLLHLYAASVKAHKANGLNQFQAVLGARRVLLKQYQFDINHHLILNDVEYLARVGMVSNEREKQDRRFWFPDEIDDGPNTTH
ncbi:conserved hypothetical protein [Acidithiobacillus ferrooxidans ATCC 23270]|uniref:AntA/AntB antirepressor domain-containing protein n=1 Tax=Acidithiobacillus ferrooxidans (strain ATCC 23270 / DSM 14882 / CIP 104768 / NCIMB 8455) TaxID=243159 RepID=B7J9D1_ACIF2|nr:antA/AntB antirepressor family protein [Acidithiobacillus ferrooxidans]ACK79879.1 conserved hypothetical protein [Acidithiobacillus ferrooxidans ATCC 23270]